MQVEELKDGVTNLMLRGRLDTVGTEAIKGPFNAVADTKRAIVVDLSQVTFLTSWGIRMLVLGAKVVTNKGGKIVLSSPNGWVQFVLARIRHEGVDLCDGCGAKPAIHVANRCQTNLPRGSAERHNRHDRRYTASLRPAIRPAQETHN